MLVCGSGFPGTEFGISNQEGEPMAIRRFALCGCASCKAYCPLCQELKAKTKNKSQYPDLVDWVVCDDCQKEEDNDQEQNVRDG